MFALHDKSSVRSAARRTLRIILNDPYHRGASVIGEVLTKQMEQSAGNGLIRSFAINKHKQQTKNILDNCKKISAEYYIL